MRDRASEAELGSISGYADIPGGLMPALHAIVDRDGYIDPALVSPLADVFNLSEADVHGVITFYKDFRTTPPAGPVVQVCRAEACQSRGATPVWEKARALAGAGAPVELEEVFCLGNCALGPSVAIEGRVHGRVDEAGIARLLTGPDRDEPGQPDGRDDGQVVYVPGDSAARSVGADLVARALSEHGFRVIRNGSRGMLWLEPLIEVVTEEGRVAYGPVTGADVPALVASGLGQGGEHPLRLGPTERLPWMERQDRFTFRRVGVVDPGSADDYEANGGMRGLRKALSKTPSEVVAEVTASGLRGRGGAAFPAGIKWQTVLEAPGEAKYVACNADEGDSGTFADRMLLEGDPFLLIEGMIIAGWAVGAHEGYVYIRSEYPDAIAMFSQAVSTSIDRGWLGDDILGSGFSFRIEVRVGAGSYVCGEETAMLESLEGRRGMVRVKPPLPAHEGLFGMPTLVNNVLTLATVPAILTEGAEAYAARGTGRSLGTQVFQLAGNIARGGVYETSFGATLSELVNELGGGTGSGRPIRAVQVGGPLGAYLPADRLDMSMDYETLAAEDALLGHGGVVVFDDTVDMAAQARFAMEFCAIESCGKCTPCRIGSTRGVELIDRITAGVDIEENMATLVDLCDVMTDGSLCAMGGLTPLPVRSALTHFADDFLTPSGTGR